MGQKASSASAGGKAKGGGGTLKKAALRTKDITAHHRRRIPDGKDPIALSRSWAKARFDFLTRFDADEDGKPINPPMLRETHFEDDGKLVRKMFLFLAHKNNEADVRATRSHDMTREQWTNAVANLASLSAEDMAKTVVEAILFSYNLRDNRLHPNSMDASSIRKVLIDAGASDDVSSAELTSFFLKNTGSKGGALAPSQAETMMLDVCRPDLKLVKKEHIKMLKHPPHLHEPPLAPGGEDFGDDGPSESDDDDDDNDDDDNGESEEKAKSAIAGKPSATIYTVPFQKGPMGMKLASNANGLGCSVSLVVPDSQAAKAGVAKGHKLIKVAGVPCRNSTQAMELLKTKPRPVSVVFAKSPSGGGDGGDHASGGSAQATTAVPNTAVPNTAVPTSKPKAGAKRAQPAQQIDEAKEESKDTIQKKVILMRKLRDKKVELASTDSPDERARLTGEIQNLMKRLQAVDQGATGGPKTKPPAKKPPVAAPADDEETYDFIAQQGRIGIGLVDKPGGKVTVDQIAKGTQAAKCDEMEQGDVLVAVAGKSVRGMTRDQVMDMLKSEKRPVKMTFELGDSDDEGGLTVQYRVQ